MPQYISDRARKIDLLGSLSIICLNLGNMSAPTFQDIVNSMEFAINKMDEMLTHNNVRVREHAKLGVPVLPKDPIYRKLRKRFENTVHVLCVLADSITGEYQGQPPTQQEIRAVDECENILQTFKAHIYEILPNWDKYI